jgi:hypothetical protein
MSIPTYTVSEAIKAACDRWHEFRDEPQRVTGELAAHSFGACLYDTENKTECIHIPGSWIFRALPNGANSLLGGGIGGFASHTGNGSVTGNMDLGGLCGAALTMANVQCFELDDEPNRIVVRGPFSDLDELEILGRFGRNNAVARWPGIENEFMITMDELTLRTIQKQIERIGDPKYAHRKPVERIQGVFDLYISAIDEIVSHHPPSAG